MKRPAFGSAVLATLVATACHLQSPAVPVPRTSPDGSNLSPVFNHGSNLNRDGSSRTTGPAETALSPVEIEKPAPNVSFYDSMGGRHTLDEYKGRFIALVFFAYYCPTCRAEMPAVQQFASQYGSDRVAVVAIEDSGAAYDTIKTFGQQLGLTLPLFNDPDQVAPTLFKVSSTSTAYFISPDFVVRATTTRGLSLDYLKQELDHAGSMGTH